MCREHKQLVGLLLLLVLLAACGTVSQALLPSSTPAATATRGISSLSFSVPARVASKPPATPQTPKTPGPPTQPTSSTQGGSSLPPHTSVEAQLEQKLFDLINQDRADEGLPAYTINSIMSNGARLHSWKMADCGLSHQCSGEAAPCDRVSNEGISWTHCGENVGYSSPSPTALAAVQGIEQAMLNEPPPAGHRANLLSSSFHRIGVGIYIDSRGYVWITEDFAS